MFAIAESHPFRSKATLIKRTPNGLKTIGSNIIAPESRSRWIPVEGTDQRVRTCSDLRVRGVWQQFRGHPELEHATLLEAPRQLLRLIKEPTFRLPISMWNTGSGKG